MAIDIIMPQLGMGMLEGTIVRWIAADGAAVHKGDELVEIQTEKIIHTIEAAKDGILQRVAPEGTKIPVRQLVGYLLAPGEARVGPSRPAEPPAPVTQARGSVGAASPTQGEVRATPIARRLASEHGVELALVVGTGPGGRIVEKDVLAFAEAARQPAPPTAEPAAPAPPAVEANTVPVTGIRQVIFERMARSAQTVARVTEFTEVDATALVELRARFKERLQRAENLSVSYNDLLILIVSHALREHRQLNSTLVDGQIRLVPEINVGLAVDSERGLLVPVIHRADALSVAEIAREGRRLVERALAGKSLPEDFAGGTFTLTNIGTFEVDGFTPIVNLPECAILGVGRIVAKPAVYDGRIAIRQMMTLSLSFDHRLVDGAPAARFLQHVKHLIEEPYLLL